MRRLIPLLAVLALAFVLWRAGLAEALSWEQLARHHRSLADWAAREPAVAAGAYVMAYSAATALSLPIGLLSSVLGGVLFGALAGSLLAASGATIGATMLFLLARSAIGERLPSLGGARAQSLRMRLQRDGFNYLLAIRLVPLFPFWLVNLAAAFCGMPLGPYVLATALGILPVSAVLAWTGASLGEVIATGQQPDFGSLFKFPVLAPLIGLAALALAPLLLRNRRDPGL